MDLITGPIFYYFFLTDFNRFSPGYVSVSVSCNMDENVSVNFNINQSEYINIKKEPDENEGEPFQSAIKYDWLVIIKGPSQFF